MLAGPDADGLAAVLAATGVDVVASGGVSSLDDLRALAALEAGGRRLAGAIVGTALYEGRSPSTTPSPPWPDPPRRVHPPLRLVRLTGAPGPRPLRGGRGTPHVDRGDLRRPRRRQGRAWWGATGPARPASCGSSPVRARRSRARSRARAASATSTRTPGRPRRWAPPGPSTTCSRAGVSTSWSCAWRSSACAWRRTRPTPTWPATPAPSTPSSTPAATPPSPRCAASRPASAWPATASTSPSPCSPAASAGGSSWPASCSPAATCCCSTSPPTTSTPTPRPG